MACKPVATEENHENGPRWSWANNHMGNLSFCLFGAAVLLSLATHACAATGTIRLTKAESTDDGCAGYATFGSHNQKVVSNRNGIFITYMSLDTVTNGLNNKVTWRLARSTDGGLHFTKLCEVKNSKSNAPALETDEDANLYLISVGGIGPWDLTKDSWSNVPTDFRIFHASDNYQTPTVTQPVPTSAGKYTSAYDPVRKVIYYMTWNYWYSTPQFFVLGRDGSRQNSVQLWHPADTQNHKYLCSPQYPYLCVTKDGIVFAAWTTEDLSFPKTYNYHDARFIGSEDGGKTWIGQRGNLTPPIDPGPDGPSWEIMDGADIKPVGSTPTVNWLNNMFYNQRKLHFVYKSTKGNQVYRRFDWVSRTFDDRFELANIHGETMTVGIAHGFFSGTDTGRLFYTSGGANTYYNHVITLYSDDGGDRWHDYAASPFQPDQINFTGGARQLTSNGSIIGTFTTTKWPSYICFFCAPEVTKLP